MTNTFSFARCRRIINIVQSAEIRMVTPESGAISMTSLQELAVAISNELPTYSDWEMLLATPGVFGRDYEGWHECLLQVAATPRSGISDFLRVIANSDAAAQTAFCKNCGNRFTKDGATQYCSNTCRTVGIKEEL